MVVISKQSYAQNYPSCNGGDDSSSVTYCQPNYPQYPVCSEYYGSYICKPCTGITCVNDEPNCLGCMNGGQADLPSTPVCILSGPQVGYCVQCCPPGGDCDGCSNNGDCYPTTCSSGYMCTDNGNCVLAPTPAPTSIPTETSVASGASGAVVVLAVVLFWWYYRERFKSRATSTNDSMVSEGESSTNPIHDSTAKFEANRIESSDEFKAVNFLKSNILSSLSSLSFADLCSSTALIAVIEALLDLGEKIYATSVQVNYNFFHTLP